MQPSRHIHMQKVPWFSEGRSEESQLIRKEEEEGMESTMASVIRATTSGICQVTKHVILMFLCRGVPGLLKGPQAEQLFAHTK